MVGLRNICSLEQGFEVNMFPGYFHGHFLFCFETARYGFRTMARALPRNSASGFSTLSMPFLTSRDLFVSVQVAPSSKSKSNPRPHSWSGLEENMTSGGISWLMR